MKNYLTRYPFAVGIAIAAVGFFALLAFCSNADAREWYVKAEVGTTVDTELSTSFGSIELSDELTYGGAVGTDLGPVRVEAGVSHLAGDINFGPISVNTSAVDYSATAYLDTYGGFYVGAGIDYLQAEASFGPFSTDTEGFGYHGAVGYAHRLNDRTILEVQAEYLEADLDNVDVSGVAITTGVRFRL